MQNGGKVMQEEHYQIVERAPTIEEYFALRKGVGWMLFAEEMTAKGLANALFSVCVLHQGEVIGCGRVVGDGGLYFYVQDIIILPDFQGKGLGKRLMQAIMAFLEENAQPGAFIGLMAAKGSANFYTQFGFAARPFDQPGMFRRQGTPARGAPESR
jgi:GNAT superfamily N-acetyltransferase